MSYIYMQQPYERVTVPLTVLLLLVLGTPTGVHHRTMTLGLNDQAVTTILVDTWDHGTRSDLCDPRIAVRANL